MAGNVTSPDLKEIFRNLGILCGFVAGDCRVKATSMDFGGLAEAVIVIGVRIQEGSVFLSVVAKQVGGEIASE